MDISTLIKSHPHLGQTLARKTLPFTFIVLIVLKLKNNVLKIFFKVHLHNLIIICLKKNANNSLSIEKQHVTR